MPQNFPYNGQQFTNDIAITDSYPKVQWGGTEPGAVYFEDVEVAGTMYQKVQNAAYIKWSNTWILVDPTQPAYAISFQNGTMNLLTNPAQNTPFSAWQVSGSIVGSPRATGIQLTVPADGSSAVSITYSTPFLTSTSEVFLSIGGNYSGTDNAVIAARLTATPSKTGFTAIVNGGQAGTTVNLHYLAFGQ